MTESFEIEPLGNAHVRTGFSCGVIELDRYFRELVSQDIRRRVSNCFVAIDGAGTVAGYYTFAATSLPMTELTAEETKRLPRYPVLPAGLIGRLAVDQRFRGQGPAPLSLSMPSRVRCSLNPPQFMPWSSTPKTMRQRIFISTSDFAVSCLSPCACSFPLSKRHGDFQPLNYAFT